LRLQTFDQPSLPAGARIALNDCIGDLVAATGWWAMSAAPRDPALPVRFAQGVGDGNWRYQLMAKTLTLRERESAFSGHTQS